MLDRLKQIRAGVLDVGYVEVGPAPGQPVLLLHGWPYDIHSFEEVAPPSPTPATAWSCRTYADTAPRASSRMTRSRNGQQAALAVDAIALMDALGIDLSDHRRL